MNVTEVRFLNPNDRCYFRGKWRTLLRHGNDTRNDEIPGLNISLNPQTSIVSVDAPGDSISLHLSALAIRMEPAIDEAEHAKAEAKRRAIEAKEQAEREEQERKEAPKAAKVKPVTAAELGFDPDGDDIDDREVAKLLQGKGAKKSLEKRVAKKKKAPAKGKAKAKPTIFEEGADDDLEGDEDDVE